VNEIVSIVNGKKKKKEKTKVKKINKKKEKKKELKKEEKKKDNKRRRVEKEVVWVYPNLAVRIISKSFKHGQFYRKKATVVDVVSDDNCTLVLDDGNKYLEGISQKMLETVIPIPGKKVMIVRGNEKGKFGTLFEKSRDKQTGRERVVIKMSGTMELRSFRLDDISEYRQ